MDVDIDTDSEWEYTVGYSIYGQKVTIYLKLPCDSQIIVRLHKYNQKHQPKHSH